MRDKVEHSSYTGQHVQEKKKWRTLTSNDVEDNSVDLLAEPPPPEFTDIPLYSSTKFKLWHVEEIQEYRSHRLPPHSASPTLAIPPLHRYKSQAAYAITSGPGNTYHDSLALEQHTFLSNPDTSLPDNASGHGMY